MTRKEKAMNYFLEGYNCSQSVVLAFADMLDMEPDKLVRFSSSFGGGMGRLREVCGSVSGMFIVLGMLYGYDDPKDFEGKKALYEKVQNLAHQFEAENGSIVCRDLLGLSEKSQEPTPEKRSKEYYSKRPCKELVGIAAELLEMFIKQENSSLQ